MDWLALLITGLFEILWVIAIDLSDGFTKLIPTILTVITTIISYILVAYAIKTIPMRTAYAVWSGIGVFGAAFVGIVFMGVSKDFMRIVCLLLTHLTQA